MRQFAALIRLSLFPLAALALLGQGLLSNAEAQQRWENYENARFGYRLLYPAGVFRPQPAPDNSDGQTFVAEDGRAKIVVYGTYNDERFSPAEYRNTILKEFQGYDQMDYSPRGRSWFVLSGFRGDTIYYQKVMFSCGNSIINVLSVTFPTAEKPFYEGLVERMEDNFKPGPCRNQTR